MSFGKSAFYKNWEFFFGIFNLNYAIILCKIAKIGSFKFPKFRPGIGFSALESAIQCKIDRLIRLNGQYGPNQIYAKNRFLELRIFLGDCRGGSVVVWHTGHFASYHSMDTSLQETFPINQPARINYRKWVISNLKIRNFWEQLEVFCWESGFFWDNFPIDTHLRAERIYPTAGRKSWFQSSVAGTGLCVNEKTDQRNLVIRQNSVNKNKHMQIRPKNFW